MHTSYLAIPQFKHHEICVLVGRHMCYSYYGICTEKKLANSEIHTSDFSEIFFVFLSTKHMDTFEHLAKLYVHVVLSNLTYCVRDDGLIHVFAIRWWKSRKQHLPAQEPKLMSTVYIAFSTCKWN